MMTGSSRSSLSGPICACGYSPPRIHTSSPDRARRRPRRACTRLRRRTPPAVAAHAAAARLVDPQARPLALGRPLRRGPPVAGVADRVARGEDDHDRGREERDRDVASRAGLSAPAARRCSSQAASSASRSARQRVELGLQLAQARVVGRAGGHRLVQRRLALAEPLQRALQRARPPCARRATTAPGAGAARRGPRGAAGGGAPSARAAAQRDVLVDAARQVADAAVAVERVDVVADPLDEVAVVADDDERARPARRAGPRAR